MDISKIQPGGIDSINFGQQTKSSGATDAAKQVGQTFSQILSNLEKTQSESDNLFKKLAAGEDVDLHQVMIAAEQNDVAFKVTLAIRDKLVEAYKEITRMTV
jgi:flagellar hook-basal body complex protein FliE